MNFFLRLFCKTFGFILCALLVGSVIHFLMVTNSFSEIFQDSLNEWIGVLTFASIAYLIFVYLIQSKTFEYMFALFPKRLLVDMVLVMVTNVFILTVLSATQLYFSYLISAESTHLFMYSLTTLSFGSLSYIGWTFCRQCRIQRHYMGTALDERLLVLMLCGIYFVVMLNIIF